MTLATPVAARRLLATRTPADARAVADDERLGTLAYAADGGRGTAIPLRALPLGSSAVQEHWCGAAPVRSGRTGTACWRHDGQWLWVALDLAADGADLEAQTRLAYETLFAALGEAGFRHLLRVWNYLPQINADSDGIERYWRFNAGRQQALLDAGHAAFEGAAAASALGTHDGAGRLCLRALAGRAPALAIENPRQVSAYRYPREYGARSPSFSRAALLDAGDGRLALLVSGTASIVGHTSLHAGDVRAQTRETLANLRAVLDAAAAHTDARFDVAALHSTVYLRHASDIAAVQAVLQAELGTGAATPRQAIWLEADICRRELLVEIEAHAFTTGRIVR